MIFTAAAYTLMIVGLQKLLSDAWEVKHTIRVALKGGELHRNAGAEVPTEVA